MNLMSTDKSIYSYYIKSIHELSESCYLRRQIKAQQNNKDNFAFIINKDFSNTELLAQFLNSKLKAGDLVIANLTQSLELKKINPALDIILKLSKEHELEKLSSISIKKILFTPSHLSDLRAFVSFYKKNLNHYNFYWSFRPYNPEIRNSITVKDIINQDIEFQRLAGLDIYNHRIPPHYELEPIAKSSYKIDWDFKIQNSQPIVSVIIPSFNNAAFLSNVIWHLINQSIDKKSYEVIVVDDGSSDNSSAIIFQSFETFKNDINLTYIYWSKNHPLRGSQNFFRPGLARNLASRYSRGEYLFFLDSDMLVPPHFIESVINSMKYNDIIQYQRFHINQDLSKARPNYQNVDLKKDTYIEEKPYWSELFFCENWSQLPFYWKYTCTYALGISKKNFYKLGLFKKYYISYGFEDTDIGYEAHKKNMKFSLVQIPLLHLTAYDQMQYKNSMTKRFSLLKITAELFYLQHLDKDIYHLLGNYYRFQKPMKSFFRDLIS